MSGGVCPAAMKLRWSPAPERCVGADMSLFCSQVAVLKSHREHQQCDAAPRTPAIGNLSYYSCPGVQMLSHSSKYRYWVGSEGGGRGLSLMAGERKWRMKRKCREGKKTLHSWYSGVKTKGLLTYEILGSVMNRPRKTCLNSMHFQFPFSL